MCHSNLNISLYGFKELHILTFLKNLSIIFDSSKVLHYYLCNWYALPEDISITKDNGKDACLLK